MASDILVVDDETDIRDLISGILEDEGHSTRLAKDSDETLQTIEERRPSLVILDIWLQGSKLDGLELLDRIKKAHPDLPVIIISGHGNIETAVAAIKRGARAAKGEMSESDAQLAARNALRGMRYNSGKDYVFVYDAAGTSLVHPAKPDNEGKNLINSTVLNQLAHVAVVSNSAENSPA